MELPQQKMLIIAHGHPEISKGGAEVAAYNMFKELERQGKDVYFLARTNLAPHGGAAFSTRNSERELLFHTSMDDDFLFSNLKTRHLWGEFADLLALIQPDIVHLHHYYFIGIEVFNVIKKVLPNAKIILTLHEYLAICHNKGLMRKTNGNLCSKSSFRDCSICFPEKSPGDFYLRKSYILQAFNLVDHFVTPSQFLKQRYVEWGISADRITVIENGQVSTVPQYNIALPDEGREFVSVAFFGQINPHKGLDVLLKSLSFMTESTLDKLHVTIYGSGLESQTRQFIKMIKSFLDDFEDNVHYHGHYEQSDMPGFLANTDLVVVPSIWWENSPMVIQEAFMAKVPVVASNIGGMAEKVSHGNNGFLFQANSPSSLASVLSCIARKPETLKSLSANIQPPLPINDFIQQHEALYASLDS